MADQAGGESSGKAIFSMDVDEYIEITAKAQSFSSIAACGTAEDRSKPIFSLEVDELVEFTDQAINYSAGPDGGEAGASSPSSPAPIPT